MLRVILVWLVCVTPLIAAESAGYRVVHPDGTVEFTDQPVEGAEPISIPELPTYSLPSGGASSTGSTNTTTPPQGKAGKKQAVSKSITITSPAAESMLTFNANGINVSVQVSPALEGGQQVIIRMDGSEVARGGSTSFMVPGVYRGAHVLSAAIVDSGGAVLQEATPITFYVRQHSIK